MHSIVFRVPHMCVCVCEDAVNVISHFDVHVALLFNFIFAVVAVRIGTLVKLGAAFNRIRMEIVETMVYRSNKNV